MLFLQKLITKIQLPMIFLMPFWVATGRDFFDAGGWGILVTLLVLAPALFVSLLVLYILIRSRSDVLMSQMVSKADAVMLSILYVACFLFGFCVVDGGDTPQSVRSAASNLFGQQFRSLSSAISLAGLIVAIVMIAVILIDNIYLRVRPGRKI